MYPLTRDYQTTIKFDRTADLCQHGLNDEKVKDQWMALPYALASAVVKTLCAHAHRIQLQMTKAQNTEGSAEAVVAKEYRALAEMKNCTLYIVWRNRTQTMATGEFAKDMMVISDDGKLVLVVFPFE